MSDIGNIAATSSAMSMVRTRAEADVAVLRKALDQQAIQAAQLIESLPDANPVSPAGNPQDPTQLLGNLVNTRA